MYPTLKPNPTPPPPFSSRMAIGGGGGGGGGSVAIQQWQYHGQEISTFIHKFSTLGMIGCIAVKKYPSISSMEVIKLMCKLHIHFWGIWL